MIEACIKQYIDIDDQSLERIISKFSYRYNGKGEYLLKVGNRSNALFFIKSGYLRLFNIADGKEITLWVGTSGQFVTSVSSFVFQSENIWNIQSVTASEVLVIQRNDHFELCDKEPRWLAFDNILLARSFEILESRMFAHLYTTAQQRFENLFITNPEIFNHVPLQYIASMLGITPETLSRLRKKATSVTS